MGNFLLVNIHLRSSLMRNRAHVLMHHKVAFAGASVIKLALKKEPIYIGLEDQHKDGAATVSGLEQVRLQSILLMPD